MRWPRLSLFACLFLILNSFFSRSALAQGPLYDSGWQLSTSGPVHTFTHNLGAYPTLWSLMAADDAAGSYATPMLIGNYEAGGTLYGFYEAGMTGSVFNVGLRAVGYAHNGAYWYVRGSDYIRLIIFATTNSYSWSGGGAATSICGKNISCGGFQDDQVLQYEITSDNWSNTSLEMCNVDLVCGVYQDEFVLQYFGGANQVGFATLPTHHERHELDGLDEINVGGLSGILTDTQDAGWFHDSAITTTGVTDGQVLAWNTTLEQWEPTTVSGTGGMMPDTITATISGTVPVIITSTYQYTKALSSGRDLAVSRSFTYGEASIAIALFAVALMLALQLIFRLARG